MLPQITVFVLQRRGHLAAVSLFKLGLGLPCSTGNIQHVAPLRDANRGEIAREGRALNGVPDGIGYTFLCRALPLAVS